MNNKIYSSLKQKAKDLKVKRFNPVVTLNGNKTCS